MIIKFRFLCGIQLWSSLDGLVLDCGFFILSNGSRELRFTSLGLHFVMVGKFINLNAFTSLQALFCYFAKIVPFNCYVYFANKLVCSKTNENRVRPNIAPTISMHNFIAFLAFRNPIGASKAGCTHP